MEGGCDQVGGLDPWLSAGPTHRSGLKPPLWVVKGFLFYFILFFKQTSSEPTYNSSAVCLKGGLGHPHCPRLTVHTPWTGILLVLKQASHGRGAFRILVPLHQFFTQLS